MIHPLNTSRVLELLTEDMTLWGEVDDFEEEAGLSVCSAGGGRLTTFGRKMTKRWKLRGSDNVRLGQSENSNYSNVLRGDGAATPMLGTATPLVGSGSATPVVCCPKRLPENASNLPSFVHDPKQVSRENKQRDHQTRN